MRPAVPNYQLFPNMTVADNVCAGVKDAGDAAARKKLAERYLGIFGLADFADRYPARSRAVSSNAWRLRAWWRRIRAFLCSTSP